MEKAQIPRNETIELDGVTPVFSERWEISQSDNRSEKCFYLVNVSFVLCYLWIYNYLRTRTERKTHAWWSQLHSNSLCTKLKTTQLLTVTSVLTAFMTDFLIFQQFDRHVMSDCLIFTQVPLAYGSRHIFTDTDLHMWNTFQFLKPILIYLNECILRK